MVFYQLKGREYMANCISKSLKAIVNDAKELRSSEPNRLRGCLWLLASAVSLVAGFALTCAGGACLFGSTALAFSGVGMVGAVMLGGLGVSLVLSGVPAGMFMAAKLGAKGWVDLAGRKATLIPTSSSSISAT